jgi:hypothetical protein
MNRFTTSPPSNVCVANSSRLTESPIAVRSALVRDASGFEAAQPADSITANRRRVARIERAIVALAG